MRLTDWHTDDLFAWLSNHGATLLVNRVSRLVVDPERFVDPSREPAEASGQGVVYTRTTEGARMRLDDPAARARLIERHYRPWHAALDEAASELLDTFGRCTLIDGHSFPSVALPSDLDRAPGRPGICIGRDPWHTPDDLAEALAQAFRDTGLSVAFDRPYAGSMVPASLHGRDLRLRSVMIEVRRDLYLDESSGERSAGYAATRAAIERAIAASGAID